MVSIHVLAIPMIGLARSSSVNPMAFSMARAGARSLPWVIVWLLSFIAAASVYQRREYDRPPGLSPSRLTVPIALRPARSYTLAMREAIVSFVLVLLCCQSAASQTRPAGWT